MQRVLELEYDEIIFGLNLDSLRFSYAKNIPIFYTLDSFEKIPDFDFKDINEFKKEYFQLDSRTSLLGLQPLRNCQSARLENSNLLKLSTITNLVVKINFNKLWIANGAGLYLEGMPVEAEKKNYTNLVVDSIAVRSGLYHEFWELETDGEDFVKKIIFTISNRFFYKNIDNKKDCIVLSYIKPENIHKFEYSELAVKMKTANYMEKAGIKGRWDKTNNRFKKIKLESVCRNVYPIFELFYKDLPSNFEMLYNVPATFIKDGLYGELQKLQVQ